MPFVIEPKKKMKTIKKARTIVHLLRHRKQYIDPALSYYPDREHKLEREILKDQIGHVLRYGYLCHEYYPLGIDVKGEDWRDYLPAYYSLKVLAEQNKKMVKKRRGFNYALALDDKWTFSQLMENNRMPIPETIGLVYFGKFMPNHGQGRMVELEKLLDHEGKFLLKPVLGISGKGIVSIEIHDRQLFSRGEAISVAELYEKVKDNKYLVQRFVTNQHPAMKALFDKTLNTIRVTMVRTDAGVDVLGCMCLMGASDSEYSNWHYGGTCTNVDAGGRLGKYGFSKSKKRITAHPDTGTRFEGYQLPYFEEIIDLCRRAMDLFKHRQPVAPWTVFSLPC